MLLSVFISIVSNKYYYCDNTDVEIGHLLGNRIFDSVKYVYMEYTRGFKLDYFYKIKIFNQWLEDNKNILPIIGLFNTDSLNVATYSIFCVSIFIDILVELYLIVMKLDKQVFNLKRKVLFIC